jgi:hypothetical protein
VLQPTRLLYGAEALTLKFGTPLCCRFTQAWGASARTGLLGCRVGNRRRTARAWSASERAGFTTHVTVRRYEAREASNDSHVPAASSDKVEQLADVANATCPKLASFRHLNARFVEANQSLTVHVRGQLLGGSATGWSGE